MRIALITTAAASTLAIASVAVADTSYGTIATIEPGNDAVTLMDGSTFQIPDDSATSGRNILTGYTAGDDVFINWIVDGDERLAQSISSPGLEVVQARLTEVDLTDNSVTLANGTEMTFMTNAQNQSPLVGYRPGDLVDISYILSVTPDMGVSGPIGVLIEEATTPAAVGTITEIDTVSNSVTLDDGVTYTVAAREDGQSSLAGFKVGDDVVLQLLDDEGSAVATAVTPL